MFDKVRLILLGVGQVINPIVCGCMSSLWPSLFELFIMFIKINI